MYSNIVKDTSYLKAKIWYKFEYLKMYYYGRDKTYRY